jgi:hypothetical protein
MLYIFEAKSAVMKKLGKLNDRLKHAKLAEEHYAHTDPFKRPHRLAVLIQVLEEKLSQRVSSR